MNNRNSRVSYNCNANKDEIHKVRALNRYFDYILGTSHAFLRKGLEWLASSDSVLLVTEQKDTFCFQWSESVINHLFSSLSLESDVLCKNYLCALCQ